MATLLLFCSLSGNTGRITQVWKICFVRMLVPTNNAVGNGSLENNTTGNNTAVGNNALNQNTGGPLQLLVSRHFTTVKQVVAVLVWVAVALYTNKMELN